jgi:hypothetical protein
LAADKAYDARRFHQRTARDEHDAPHLWADRFDKPLADLFDMQDEIVARLAGANYVRSLNDLGVGVMEAWRGVIGLIRCRWIQKKAPKAPVGVFCLSRLFSLRFVCPLSEFLNIHESVIWKLPGSTLSAK